MKNALNRACIVLSTLFLATLVHGEKTAPKPIAPTAVHYSDELTDTGLSGGAKVDVFVKADATATLSFTNERPDIGGGGENRRLHVVHHFEH